MYTEGRDAEVVIKTFVVMFDHVRTYITSSTGAEQDCGVRMELHHRLSD